MSSSDRLHSSPTGGWPTPSVHVRTCCEVTYLATGKITKRIEEIGCKRRTRIEDLYITENSSDGVSGKKVRLLTHYDVDGNMNGKAQALFVVKEKTADDITGRYTTTSVLLSPSEYNLLRRRLSGRHGCRRVAKVRVSLGDNLGYAYVYMGELSGLVTVTIKGLEYGDEYLRLVDTPPNGCLSTHPFSSHFSGESLAGSRYKDIEPYLIRLGYVKQNCAI